MLTSDRALGTSSFFRSRPLHNGLDWRTTAGAHAEKTRGPRVPASASSTPATPAYPVQVALRGPDARRRWNIAGSIARTMSEACEADHRADEAFRSKDRFGRAATPEGLERAEGREAPDGAGRRADSSLL